MGESSSIFSENRNAIVGARKAEGVPLEPWVSRPEAAAREEEVKEVVVLVVVVEVAMTFESLSS